MYDKIITDAPKEITIFIIIILNYILIINIVLLARFYKKILFHKTFSFMPLIQILFKTNSSFQKVWIYCRFGLTINFKRPEQEYKTPLNNRKWHLCLKAITLRNYLHHIHTRILLITKYTTNQPHPQDLCKSFICNMESITCYCSYAT